MLKISLSSIILLAILATGILLGNAYALVSYSENVTINPGTLNVNAGLQSSGTDAVTFTKTRSATNAVRYEILDVGGLSSDAAGGAFWRGYQLGAPAITVASTPIFARLTTYAEYNSLTDPSTRLWVIDASNADGTNQKHDIAYRISGTTILYLDDSGKVGIGTTIPTEKLDVNGNMRYTGNIVSPNQICIGTCP